MRKLTAFILLAILFCIPIFSNNNLVLLNYPHNILEDTLDQDRRKINLYCTSTDTSFNTYASFINDIPFINFNVLAYLMDFNYRKEEDKIIGLTPFNGATGEEKIFELPFYDAWGTFDAQSFIMPFRGYNDTIYISIKAFAETLDKTFYYDYLKDVYVIGEKDQNMPKIQSYPTVPITFKFGKRTVTMDTISINNILCMNIMDFADLMNLECEYATVNEFGRAWQLYTVLLNGECYSLSVLRDTKEVFFNTFPKRIDNAILPIAPFDYKCRGLYVPLRGLTEAMGRKLTFEDTTVIRIR